MYGLLTKCEVKMAAYYMARSASGQDESNPAL